jgi:hypothetical protein
VNAQNVSAGPAPQPRGAAWIAFCGTVIAAFITGLFMLSDRGHESSLAPAVETAVPAQAQTLRRTVSSPYLEGGHTRLEWCEKVLAQLRGEYPSGASFAKVGDNERSHSRCSPFNCPLYQYDCSFDVTVPTHGAIRQRSANLERWL